MTSLSMEKLQARQGFRNVWHTDLVGTMSADLPHFCFALWCSPCASYLLRKRALYDDMSRYVCCAGYMPCSGSCGESKCPEFCLCTETQHKVELDKRDGNIGPMRAPQSQHMSRIDKPVPPSVGYGGPSKFDQPAYGHPYAPSGYPSQSYPQQPYGYPQQQQYSHQPYQPFPPR